MRQEPAMADQTPAFVFAGDNVLYVFFPNRLDPAVNGSVVALFHALRARSARGIGEIVPAYRTLMITFDSLLVGDEQLVEMVREALADRNAETTTGRCVTLPVAYGGTYGPDLPVVAGHSGLSPDEVIRRHAAAWYDVFFLGFTPGFPFLGGMPPELATPRRAQPRLRVEAGSVGIAGSQTGVYPLPSPGGWQIIGRTPVPLYTAGTNAELPVLLRPGDHLRFQAIDDAAFSRIAVEVREHRYQVEIDACHGG
jgi:inhibitor of KinA